MCPGVQMHEILILQSQASEFLICVFTTLADTALNNPSVLGKGVAHEQQRLA